MYSRLKEWSDYYGDIFSLKIGAGTIIVLTDRQAIHELIENRGANYADRPIDHNSEVAAGKENFVLGHSNARWRAMRKITTSSLTPQLLDGKLASIQEAEYECFLSEL